MSQALYSKYRPKVFTDVVGQKHILTTLQNAIEQNKVSHAYLFCGPRGTGKTTMARLLAKACICKNATDSKSPTINFCGTCQDCLDAASGNHPDVYELDAASRTGVDNVRDEIISRVGFAATRASKKIYIIDEVHMLSTAAFNALLKTLEEPPEHVLFILCTTDPQKVPETIISRCQRFDFSSISIDDVVVRLKYICESEGVQADDDALQAIAQNSNGAMRNAITQLEQLIAFSQGNITLETIKSKTSSQNYNFESLFTALFNKDLKAMFEWTSHIVKQGSDFNDVAAAFAQLVRDAYIVRAGGNVGTQIDQDLMQSLNNFSLETLHNMLLVASTLLDDMKASNNLQLTFELSMAKLANPGSEYTLEALADRISRLENVSQNPTVKIAESDTSEEEAPLNVAQESSVPAFDNRTDENVEFADVSPKQHFDAVPAKPKIELPEVDTKTSAKITNEEELQKLWHKAYASIRAKYAGFAATLVIATPAYEPQTNQFILKFPESASFNVAVLKKPENIAKIHDEIKNTMGQDIGFNIEVSNDVEDDFNPTFTNNFREKPEVETNQLPVEESNPSIEDKPTASSSTADMLSNFGAFNITEE